MKVYNQATGQTADVQDKAFPVWANLGWTPYHEAPDVGDEDTAEVTAEDTGRGRHPSARATKDK